MEKRTPLISIIVPVYNVAPYLDKALESILNQTYSEIEVILVDDGSTDTSGEICEEWAKNHSAFSVIHTENRGVAAARNTGLEKSKGYIIGFLDPDDWCHEQMIEELVNKMQEDDADIVSCGFYRWTDKAENSKQMGTFDVDSCYATDAIKYFLAPNGYFTSLWNKLFRKGILTDKNGDLIYMDEDLHFGEDEVWLYRVMQNCNTVSFVPKALYYWRQREGSVVSTNEITYKHMSLVEAKKRVLDIAPQDPVIQDLVRASVYNNTFIIKKMAYCSDDDSFSYISEFIKPYKNCWLLSDNVSRKRKIKFELLNMIMSLKFPKGIVSKVYDITS